MADGATATVTFDEALDTVESLPPDDQLLLVDVIRRRLTDYRRRRLVAEVAEAEAAYERGEVRRGSIDDLMRELDA